MTAANPYFFPILTAGVLFFIVVQAGLLVFLFYLYGKRVKERNELADKLDLLERRASSGAVPAASEKELSDKLAEVKRLLAQKEARIAELEKKGGW
jgi:hypothetical protein